MFTINQVPYIMNKQPIKIRTLAPKIFIKAPTNGPVAIQAKPITDTIEPISHGPMPLTSPKNTGSKNIGA